MNITPAMVKTAQDAYDEALRFARINPAQFSADDAISATKDALYDAYQQIDRATVAQVISRITR